MKRKIKEEIVLHIINHNKNTDEGIAHRYFYTPDNFYIIIPNHGKIETS